MAIASTALKIIPQQNTTIARSTYCGESGAPNQLTTYR
jgi:hypothetical protein